MKSSTRIQVIQKMGVSRGQNEDKKEIKWGELRERGRIEEKLRENLKGSGNCIELSHSNHALQYYYRFYLILLWGNWKQLQWK